MSMFGKIGTLLLGLTLLCAPVSAAEPAVSEHDYIVKEFVFHDGSRLQDLRLHYRTLGNPSSPAVLLLHGTAGSGAAFLKEGFAGEMFGKGQPLDADKFFIILPDAIGTGKSSKPSDGLRTRFPEYDYGDMVRAQHLLVTEGLGIRHLALVMGHSMGGMHAWMWAEDYPGMMDAVVPMAAMPAAMSGRNWILRRMITDAVRLDPAWKNGNYTEQPQHFRRVNVFYGIATNGGDVAWQKNAPTRAAADAVLEKRLASPTKMDANDFLYQWQSSGSYDPAPRLKNITAPVLAILAADDERNPYATGVMQRAVSSLPDARCFLIPASEKTEGHNTTMKAAHWKEAFATFFSRVRP